MRVLLGTVAALVMGASAAMAADLPVKARPIPVEVWNWTGFYIGGNVGYSWGRSRNDVTYFNPVTGAVIAPPAGSVTSASFNLNGGVAGGQIGYNWQSGPNWVWGLEADWQWSRERGSTAFLCAATVIGGPCLPGLTFLPAGALGTGVAMDQSIEWFGTLRARAGMLLSPSVYAYVTGGLAYGSVKTGLAIASFTPNGTVVGALGSTSTTHAGWTVGAGIEALFARDWSAKLEYLYIDLGTFDNTIALVTPSIAATVRSRVTDNVFRFGINYHFNPGPVVARY